jgi:hypothetical protein
MRFWTKHRVLIWCIAKIAKTGGRLVKFADGVQVGNRADLLQDIVTAEKGKTMKRIKKVQCEVSTDKCNTCPRVEVVLCVRCKYWDLDSEYCQFWHGIRHPGHYCGEGKKKYNG